MERKEALNYLKELLASKEITPNAVTLEKLQGKEHYSVRIKTDELDKQTIEDKAKKLGFEVIADHDSIVVYKS